MYPYIQFGPVTLWTYGLCAGLAFLCARRMFKADLVRHGLPAERASVVFLLVTTAGVAGAKLYHLFQDPAALLADPVGKVLSPHGLAWLGGLLGGAAAFACLARRYRMRPLIMFDLASPMAALAYAIGRLGCLMAGDGCYGIPTSLPWGMAFPHGMVPTSQYVHPTPLYEFIVNAGISCCLWRTAGRAQPPGKVFGLYLIMTGAARFSIEFLRRNPRLYFGLSNAQVLSLGCLVVGGLLLSRLKARSNAESRAALDCQLVA